jgi:CubicO group peptidase (beta-lactamase class C family)
MAFDRKLASAIIETAAFSEAIMSGARSIASAVALSALLFSVDCGAARAQGAAAPVWPTQQWQTSTPEAQGMDSAALAKLLAFGTTRSLDSLLIARHGRIVLDAYYAPYTSDIPHALNSSTKAVVGTLAAIVHKEGLLDSYDHKMLDFFADHTIANLDDRKKAITVQNLLDMTSGLEWEEGITGGREQSLADLRQSSDWTQLVLDRSMATNPGDVFYYNSGNSHLVSAILTKLTGMKTSDYAAAKLFGPLGISTAHWQSDPQGISAGGFGLYLLPRDMAKIGYLYLRGGEWDGRQIVPPEWIDRVSHATVNMNAAFEPELRYSNFFWALPDKHVYMSVGYHCQVIMVLPEHDVVAVLTAKDFCPFGSTADMIAGTVKSDTALPPDAAGAKLLADALHDISTEKPTAVGITPALASAISGKRYRFSGALNMAMSLTLADTNPHLDLEISVPGFNLPKFSGPIGLDGLYRRGESTPFGVPAFKGRWSDDHTFVIDVQFMGAGEQRKWTLSFDGERPTLHGKARDGHEVAVAAEPAVQH